jgi:two-component system sensor histidine kinase TorS
LGAGSIFHLDLGFAPMAAPAMPSDEALAADPGLRLLVVEDHLVNQTVIRTCLEVMGHAVTIVGSGQAALEAVRLTAFDAVLMDVNLPDMSGIEVTRQILAMTRIPVIGVSAHVQPRDIAACREAGMVEILPKPIVPDRLAAALGRHCGAAGVALSVAGTLTDLGAERTQGLVALMLERMDVEVPALLKAIEDGRAAERARIAHQLKGAVGNFDMPDLVALLAAVETAETGAEAGLSLALNRARAELRRSLAALQGQSFMPAAQ